MRAWKPKQFVFSSAWWEFPIYNSPLFHCQAIDLIFVDIFTQNENTNMYTSLTFNRRRRVDCIGKCLTWRYMCRQNEQENKLVGSRLCTGTFLSWGNQPPSAVKNRAVTHQYLLQCRRTKLLQRLHVHMQWHLKLGGTCVSETSNTEKFNFAYCSVTRFLQTDNSKAWQFVEIALSKHFLSGIRMGQILHNFATSSPTPPQQEKSADGFRFGLFLSRQTFLSAYVHNTNPDREFWFTGSRS